MLCSGLVNRSGIGVEDTGKVARDSFKSVVDRLAA